MPRQRSKLKSMAEAGNPWAVRMLAQARQQAQSPAKDAAFSEAMRDAEDIRRWTDGPNAPGWRIYRLAQVLTNA
jgi:hypothetical protein